MMNNIEEDIKIVEDIINALKAKQCANITIRKMKALENTLKELQRLSNLEDKIKEKMKQCENRRFSDFTNEPNFAVEKVLKELLEDK